MLFSTYKNNDVYSLVTILDTDIITLENRGYDGEARHCVTGTRTYHISSSKNPGRV